MSIKKKLKLSAAESSRLLKYFGIIMVDKIEAYPDFDINHSDDSDLDVSEGQDGQLFVRRKLKKISTLN